MQNELEAKPVLELEQLYMNLSALICDLDFSNAVQNLERVRRIKELQAIFNKIRTLQKEIRKGYKL